MPYTLSALLARIEADDTLDFLFFWGHTNKTNAVTAACLSQWWIQPFVVDNVSYPTAEHWMMAQKAILFGDDETLKLILEAPTPNQAKALGREVKNFDNAIWEQHRFDFVATGNLHKFEQNKDLKAFLLATGDKILVEASPYDQVWGIGLTANAPNVTDPTTWRGLNLLGFALMKTRDELRDKA